MSKAIAAKIGSTHASWVEAPPPEDLAAGEVVCRTVQLGVCGTDREIIASGKPAVPKGTDYLILGHECLARVDAIGADVTDLAVGDLVVPTVRRSLGQHAERPDMLPMDQYTERGIMGQHGFSQPVWADDPHYLLRVPEAIAELAIFTEPQSVAEKAINEAAIVQRARLGESVWDSSPPRVLVTGMGPIGFACLAATWARGWPATMYGRDPDDSPRAQLAAKFQADYLNQASCDIGSLSAANRFDLVLECTGNDEVLVAASAAVAHCGAMVWLGASRVDHERIHNVDGMIRRTLIHNQIHIGSVNSAPRDFADAIAHLARLQQENPQAAAGLITRRASIEEALDHFSRRELGSIKTVFEV